MIIMKQSIFFLLVFIHLGLCVVGSWVCADAQHRGDQNGFAYRFEHEEMVYVEQRGGTVLVEAGWDNPVLEIPLGFHFHFFKQKVDRLFLVRTANGEMIVADPDMSIVQPAMMLSQMDFADRGIAAGSGGSPQSIITSHFLGEPGQRETIIQFADIGFAEDMQINGTSTDYVNFQLHFFERSSRLTVHYGASHISQPDLIYRNQTGSALGVIPAIDGKKGQVLAPGIWLEGFPTIPNSVVSEEARFLQGDIPDGTAFHILRMDYTMATSVDQAATTLALYPQPAHDRLYVKGISRPMTATIYDRWGRKMEAIPLAPSSGITIGHLTPGMYLIQLGTEPHSPILRFIKQ